MMMMRRPAILLAACSSDPGLPASTSPDAELHIYKVLNDGGTGTEDEFHHMGPRLELVAIWHCVARTEGRNGNRLAAETGMLTTQKLRQAGHDAGKDNAND
jgi:hypothetical protein